MDSFVVLHKETILYLLRNTIRLSPFHGIVLLLHNIVYYIKFFVLILH